MSKVQIPNDDIPAEIDFIHGDRNRSERTGIGGARSTGAGVYTEVHEDAEHRATPMPVRAVDLCRYV